MPQRARSPQGTLTQLRKQQGEVERKLARVQDTIERLLAVVSDHEGRRARGAKRKAARSSGRRLSNAGREAISRAAKRRWAKYRREQKRA